MNGEQLLELLRRMGVPEADIALAIVQLCRKLGRAEAYTEQLLMANKGTGPQCPQCGSRAFRKMAQSFDEEHCWIQCGVCGHHAMGTLEQAPGLQQLLRAEGIDDDEQPYFWEMP